MEMKVKALLQLGTRYIDVREAEILLADTLGENRAYLFAHHQKQCSIKEIFVFVLRVFKRMRHYPIAYITGNKEFFGLSFFVNEHVLVPRPETELIVEYIQKNAKEDNVVIDIGTGSGCIPIAVAKSAHVKKIIATDISKKALVIAKKNACKYEVDIDFRNGSLCDPLGDVDFSQEHLYISANLPYLTHSEYESELSIGREPKSALVADNHGLSLYASLCEQLAEKDIRNVTLLFECNDHQIDRLKEVVLRDFSYAHMHVKKDLAGFGRLLIAQVS